MSIKGGRRHQILYKADARLIDVGDRGIKWNPPSFTLNGKEIPEEDYVEIHDDILTRFHDYFNWIETYNPDGPKEFNRGFNYWGQTAIRDENLVKFSKLIDSLTSLFENAPENIVLTGNYYWSSSSDDEVESDPEALIVTEGYAKIEVKKDQLLKIFGDLKNLTDRAIKNKGYLLHCGI